MSDTPVFGPGDRADDVEGLLRELDATDVELIAPPPGLWADIESAITDEPRSRVVAIASHRSRLSRRFLAAAAAVAAILVAATVTVSVRSGDGVVATATLVHDPETFDPLGIESTATARLVERDGTYEIRLDDASLPDPAAADLELWLISADTDGTITDVQPVSLVDAAAPGTYTVPAGLDPDVYSIVDISIEPRDGDETHSGRSILRGTLDV